MIFAYRLSRLELMNMKWSDIDFVKNTITIHHISRNGVDDYHAYYTHLKRDEEFARTYPLLPHIKDLLIFVILFYKFIFHIYLTFSANFKLFKSSLTTSISSSHKSLKTKRNKRKSLLRLSKKLFRHLGHLCRL